MVSLMDILKLNRKEPSAADLSYIIRILLRLQIIGMNYTKLGSHP